VENGRSVLTPWKGVCSDYHEFGGMRIPMLVEVIWELDEEDFSLVKFRVSPVEFDCSVFSEKSSKMDGIGEWNRDFK
jgi:hypothetical protein